jgi:hypothetical protein
MTEITRHAELFGQKKKDPEKEPASIAKDRHTGYCRRIRVDMIDVFRVDVIFVEMFQVIPLRYRFFNLIDRDHRLTRGFSDRKADKHDCLVVCCVLVRG